jgi:hypothetical protein
MVRISVEAKNILSDWLKGCIDNPTPTDEEIETLSQQTGLTQNQVDRWIFNNKTAVATKIQRDAVKNLLGNHKELEQFMKNRPGKIQLRAILNYALRDQHCTINGKNISYSFWKYKRVSSQF